MDTTHHKSPFLINLLILIKNLSKEIMQKLRLRNVFLNTKGNTDQKEESLQQAAQLCC